MATSRLPNSSIRSLPSQGTTSGFYARAHLDRLTDSIALLTWPYNPRTVVIPELVSVPLAIAPALEGPGGRPSA